MALILLSRFLSIQSTLSQISIQNHLVFRAIISVWLPKSFFINCFLVIRFFFILFFLYLELSFDLASKVFFCWFLVIRFSYRPTQFLGISFRFGFQSHSLSAFFSIQISLFPCISPPQPVTLIAFELIMSCARTKFQDLFFSLV